MNLYTYREKLQRALNDKNFSFVLKGSFSTAITLFFVQGLRFISGVLIGRFYGAEASGRLTLLVTVMGVFSIVLNFGIKDAFQKLIPEYTHKYNLKTAVSLFKKGNQLIIAVSILGGIVLYFLSPAICTYFKEPSMVHLFRLSALFLPFFVLGDLNYYTLRAGLKIHTANVSLIIPTIIRLLALLIRQRFIFSMPTILYTCIGQHFVSCRGFFH